MTNVHTKFHEDWMSFNGSDKGRVQKKKTDKLWVSPKLCWPPPLEKVWSIIGKEKNPSRTIKCICGEEKNICLLSPNKKIHIEGSWRNTCILKENGQFKLAVWFLEGLVETPPLFGQNPKFIGFFFWTLP